MSTAVGSSSSLLQQLQASATHPQAVQSLLHQFAPQLLQLEQQIATRTATIDQDTTQLYEWVREYTVKHETDEAASTANGASTHQRNVRQTSDADAPAPLFFYLLHHDDDMQLCTAFLSALYTDPSSDQSFYWLNDPLSFVGQLQQKLHQAKEANQHLINNYAKTKRMGQSHCRNATNRRRNARIAKSRRLAPHV
jgi:hypothetical protein